MALFKHKVKKDVLLLAMLGKGFFTQADLSVKSGLNRATISKIFNKPEKPVSYQTARKIAIATGKAVDELFTIG